MRLDNCILTFMLVNRSVHSIIKVNNIQFILLNANLVFIVVNLLEGYSICGFCVLSNYLLISVLKFIPTLGIFYFNF